MIASNTKDEIIKQAEVVREKQKQFKRLIPKKYYYTEKEENKLDNMIYEYKQIRGMK